MVVVFMVEDTAEAVTEEVVLEEAVEVTDVVKSSRHPQKTQAYRALSQEPRGGK